MAESAEITNDVMVDILLRLPAKSLVRFKCVQKSWLTLIQSPSFITKHSRFAISRTDSSFLLVQHELHESEVITNLVTLHPNKNDNNDDAARIHTTINFPPPYHNQTLSFLPVSVDGIICFLVNDSSIVLWNPTIREYRVIPKNPICLPPNLTVTTEGVGFGYHAKVDDYKVISIISIWSENENFHSYLVDIYSLKTDIWRRVDANIEVDILGDANIEVDTHIDVYADCMGLYLNGNHHWETRKLKSGDEKCDIILGFDMNKEHFFEIYLPEVFYQEDSNILTRDFVTWNNCIALIIYNYVNSGEEKSFDIWVMNEYGLKESWEKKFKLRGLSLVNPLGFRNNELNLQSN